MLATVLVALVLRQTVADANDVPQPSDTDSLQTAIRLAQNGDTTAARKLFANLITKVPAVPTAHRSYAIALFEQGEEEEARAVLEQGVVHNPELYTMLLDLTNRSAASEVLAGAISQRGVRVEEICREHPDAASHALVHGIADHASHDPDALSACAVALDKGGHASVAEDALQRTVAAHPNHRPAADALESVQERRRRIAHDRDL